MTRTGRVNESGSAVSRLAPGAGDKGRGNQQAGNIMAGTARMPGNTMLRIRTRAWARRRGGMRRTLEEAGAACPRAPGRGHAASQHGQPNHGHIRRIQAGWHTHGPATGHGAGVRRTGGRSHSLGLPAEE
ncbi:MAG: hypothetical protein MPJ22_00665 [Pirellulales bacterium]|nr:hypothetical protein [Pirellulales bacterium]